MNYEDLGNRIRKKRRQLGWTQEMLATKIGVSTSFIGHVERATRTASLETLVEIANALEVSTDYLLAASLQGKEDADWTELGKLRPGQRAVMKEILRTMHDHMGAWNEDESPET